MATIAIGDQTSAIHSSVLLILPICRAPLQFNSNLPTPRQRPCQRDISGPLLTDRHISSSEPEKIKMIRTDNHRPASAVRFIPPTPTTTTRILQPPIVSNALRSRCTEWQAATHNQSARIAWHSICHSKCKSSHHRRVSFCFCFPRFPSASIHPAMRQTVFLFLTLLL